MFRITNNNFGTKNASSEKTVTNPIENDNDPTRLSFCIREMLSFQSTVEDKENKDIQDAFYLALEEAEEENYSINFVETFPSNIIDKEPKDEHTKFSISDLKRKELKQATGKQLFDIYLNANYPDDEKYIEHNAMMVTLLSNACEQQIKEFMNSFEILTKDYDVNEDRYDFSYENLGKQLLYASRAANITGQNIFNDFMNKVKLYPDLFPNYNEFAGIALGNQL